VPRPIAEFAAQHRGTWRVRVGARRLSAKEADEAATLLLDPMTYCPGEVGCGSQTREVKLMRGNGTLTMEFDPCNRLIIGGLRASTKPKPHQRLRELFDW
jgi:hypothetical protein